MTPAIVADRICKRYRINPLQRATTLREALAGLMKLPFRRGRKSAEIFWALRDVSLNVEKGEVVGLIGRNGAGKSTLLKILSKITYPTSGSARVNGRVASLLEVGTGFHSELTGRENIYLNGSILGMRKKEIDAKLDEIIEFGGIEQFLDTPIKRYSSGMRLRLGFAVAAHLNPDVLLVDEVLAVGDVEFQKKCLDAMDSLHSGGRSVLFVSHNMAAIENLCPRTIWVDEGRVRQDGPSKEVISAYLATFAGATTNGVDLRDVKARGGSGEVRFTGIDFLTPDGARLKVIRSGDNLLVRLHYQADAPVHGPHFGLQIFTDLGTKITSMSTWAAGLEIPSLQAEGHIDLHIDFLNLMPGRYYVSLWAKSVGLVSYDVLDHCAAFDVETTDFYDSGKGIDSRFGIIFLPCRWKLEGLGNYDPDGHPQEKQK